MSKELEALEDIILYLNASEPKGLYCENIEIIKTALKRIDYLERVNKDLQESKGKLIEERNNKIIEHRIVYDDYNFQSIKKFVACKDCQYYQNEKCMNKDDCFWLDLERKLKALEIIKNKMVSLEDLDDAIYEDNYHQNNEHNAIDIYNQNRFEYKHLTQEEFDLLKEVLRGKDK